MTDYTRYIVDEILPAGDFHIIYGPSGTGRSPLLYQMAYEISLSQPLFGHPSHPVPLAIISMVERARAQEQRLASLGALTPKISHLSLLGTQKREEILIDSVIRRARELVPNLQLLFIDGLTGLCPGNIMIYRDASLFLSQIHEQCTLHNLTIIGTTSCSKTDEDNVRHKPLGSMAWNDFSSTRFVLEFARPGKPDDPGRKISILPRFAPAQFLQCILDPETHCFITDDAPGLQKDLDEWLSRQQPGAVLAAADLIQVGRELKLSKATVYRWLDICEDLGLIVKVKYGVYTRAPIPTPQALQ